MRFSDFRVTVEKRSAKTEKLTRMAQHLTLSTPRSVRPPASEPSETGGTRPSREALHPTHNRASLRKTRSDRRDRPPGVALVEKPWSKS